MADTLPNVEGDGGRIVEATPVIIVDSSGSAASSTAASGSKDDANSSTAALGANAEFTGAWVTNNDPQIAVNVKADQDGTMFLEFSPDGGTTVVLSKKYDINAGEARFDALIKMPGRAHRMRFVNDAAAQGAFVLLTATGNGLFPFAQSARDEPVFVAYQAADVGATEYAILVDLSDTSNFPHNDTGRVDLHSAFFFVDKSSNTVGAIRLGVITRVDGTDADIAYIQGVSFSSADGRSFSRDRVFGSPIRLGQSGGSLTRASTQFVATGVTAVNTGITLPSSEGNVTPAVGDLIILFSHTSGGDFTGTVSIQYNADVNAS